MIAIDSELEPKRSVTEPDNEKNTRHNNDILRTPLEFPQQPRSQLVEIPRGNLEEFTKSEAICSRIARSLNDIIGRHHTFVQLTHSPEHVEELHMIGRRLKLMTSSWARGKP